MNQRKCRTIRKADTVHKNCSLEAIQFLKQQGNKITDQIRNSRQNYDLFLGQQYSFALLFLINLIPTGKKIFLVGIYYDLFYF
jgi:hypothetical protein